MKGFDPGGRRRPEAQGSGGEPLAIRESYLSLLTDLRMKRVTDDDAAKRRDDLQAKLAAIYKGAPQTNGAYSQAQKALKENEDYTFSDAEIDKFVPASLRKGS